MAYEALIVIGFGIALAVVSVGLFVAHVKRINAPNRADPTGTTVMIDLGAALAKDEAACNRKVAARGSSSKDVRGRSKDAPSELQPNGMGRRRRRSSAARADGSSVEELMSGNHSTTAAAHQDTQVCGECTSGSWCGVHAARLSRFAWHGAISMATAVGTSSTVAASKCRPPRRSLRSFTRSTSNRIDSARG